jgi:hypothetical protein
MNCPPVAGEVRGATALHRAVRERRSRKRPRAASLAASPRGASGLPSVNTEMVTGIDRGATRGERKVVDHEMLRHERTLVPHMEE